MSLVRTHNVRVDSGSDASILAIGAANTAVPRQWYYGETTDSFYFGKQDGTMSGPIPGVGYITSKDNTDTVSLDVTGGELTANVNISATANNNLINDSGLFVKKLTVHTDSSAYLEIDSNYQIKAKQLLITDNTVDSTNSTLSAHLTAVGYNSGNLIYQESDMIILTLSHQTWIQNGGTAGTTADFTAISADVTDSYIRNLFSGVSGVSYNVGTGAFSLDQSFTRGLFSGTSPVVYTAGTGIISLLANGISNSLFRTSAALSVVGNATGSTANVADITSSANDQFLVRRSGALTWGGLVAGDIPAASASKWTTTGSDIYRNSKVRIGSTSAPMYMLDVVSDNVLGALRVSALNSSFRPGINLASTFNTTTGYAASLFRHTMSNGTTEIEAGSVGIYGNMIAHPGTPSVTYMYFGTETTVAYNNNTFRLYPDKTAGFEGNTGFGTFTPSVRVHAVGDGLFTNALSVGGGTPTTAAGVISAQNGFRINNAATSGLYLRGNSTNFVASALLASDLSGTVGVVNGGTGAATLTANKVLVGNGTSAILSPTNLHWDNTNSRLGIGTASPAVSLDVNGVINAVTGYRLNATATTGTYLRGNGTNFVGSALLASDLSGTVPFANGGTGLTALGTSLQYLRTNAAGTAMEWATLTPATYTFNSGLTNTSGTVKFGGTALDQHTTLDIGNFNLFFPRGTGKVTFFNTTAGPSGFNIYNNNLEIQPSAPGTALNGMILYSPNATRWLITVDNNGALTTTSL